VDAEKAQQYRASSQDQWEGSARNWCDRADEMQAQVGEVSHWMVEAIRPQPGQTVLELAAGAGETGFLAAELIRPGGKLIHSDFAPAMVEQARERAQARGLDDVEFRTLDAEAIDLDAASIDAVLCRFGYMLMADPGAALRETRRVLRPLGRVALAAWGQPADNPWVSIAGTVVREVAGAPPPDPEMPSMFAFADPERMKRELADAGFTDVEVEFLDLHYTYPSFDAYWTSARAFGRPLAQLYDSLDPEKQQALEGELRERLGEYETADGRLEIPARPIVAAATA
jgi:SAM-dependent methyltransferase